MKKFIEELENLVATNEFQEAMKYAILDIAKSETLFDVENVLMDALSRGLPPDDDAFVSKIYKILDRCVITKRLMAQFSLN